MTSKTMNKYAPEVRERAVRRVLDHKPDRSGIGELYVYFIHPFLGCEMPTTHEPEKVWQLDLRKPSIFPSMDRLHRSVGPKGRSNEATK